MKKKPIKICVFSDTHGTHRRLKIPKCDILIFGGDAGIVSYKHLEEIGRDDCKLFFTNAIYLENASVQIEGIRFWGSPYSVMFNNWSFMGNSDYLKHIWEYIPKNTDIVITHGPSFGILDAVNWEPQGCPELRKVIDEIKPKIHITGHIHECRGMFKREFTEHINATIMNEAYNPTYNPILFDY